MFNRMSDSKPTRKPGSQSHRLRVVCPDCGDGLEEDEENTFYCHACDEHFDAFEAEWEEEDGCGG